MPADPQVEAPVSDKPSLADDPAVVSKVQSTLDRMAELVEDEVREEPEPEVEETIPQEKPEEGDEPAAEATPEEKAEEAAVEGKQSTTPILPEAYRRTAKAREWTDEEIDRFVKSDPELAIQTLSKMHDSRVKELAEWADLGRRSKQQTESPAPARTDAPAPAPALAPIDIAAMVEKYGNEDLIRELAGPLNTAIQAVAPLVQQAKQQQEVAARSQVETLGRMVQDFFTSKELAEFKGTYGSDVASLQPEQVKARSKVLELADALIAGAKMQGRSFTVEDALKAAHDSVSRDQVEKIVRDKIKGAVSTREKGITLKPSHSGNRPGIGAPRNRSELEGRTRDRLREAFG
jgi:hypothetical protein